MKAIRCDNCGTFLTLDEDGRTESENWYEVGWLSTEPDLACTRSCAVALLSDEGPFAKTESNMLAATDGP